MGYHNNKDEILKKRRENNENIKLEILKKIEEIEKE